MTKMSFGQNISGLVYDAALGGTKRAEEDRNAIASATNSAAGQLQGTGAVFGGSAPEYNPTTRLPRANPDSAGTTPGPIQIVHGNQATDSYGYVANPLALFGNYNGPGTGVSAPANQPPGQPSESGGAVFGGSTSGATSGGVGSQSPGLVSSAIGALQSWKIDPSQTVESRAAGVIGRDSELMQQARGFAMQKANERGLINSSLGIQAAQDAVIGRATDIAKQDAATAADAGKFNVNQANSWALAQQELAQKGSQFDRELSSKNSQFDKDLKYRYDAVRMNHENDMAMRAIENKYQSQLQNDAAFNAQYRAYVDALLIIDQNENLDAEAKQALKFEQARILESYAAIRGLNLNLDFSSQYKGGSGSGSGNSPASGATPAPGGATPGWGGVGGDGGNSGGGSGAGATNGGQGFGVSNGSVTAGHVGLVGNAISALTGVPGLATIGNLTGANRGIANSINAQNNLSAVAAAAPSGTPNSALSAMIDGTPLAGETTPGTATSGPNGTGGAAASAASAAASAAAAAGHSGAAQGAAAQAAADATLGGADAAAAAAAGAAAAVGADTDPSGADPGGFGGGFGGFGSDPGGFGPGGTDSNGMDGNSPW